MVREKNLSQMSWKRWALQFGVSREGQRSWAVMKLVIWDLLRSVLEDFSPRSCQPLELCIVSPDILSQSYLAEIKEGADLRRGNAVTVQTFTSFPAFNKSWRGAIMVCIDIFFKKARALPALEMKIRDFCLLMESNRVQGNALSFFVS